MGNPLRRLSAANFEGPTFSEPGHFHTGPISGVAASRDHIATAGYDNKVVLWDAASNRPIARAYHDHLVNQCEFSPDGKLLASAGSDRTVRIFRVPDLQLLALVNHDDDALKASFSPSGHRVASCDYAGIILVSGLDGRRLAECRGHEGLVERLAWATDGATFASCGTDGTIRVWDPETGACLFVRSGLATDVDDIVHLGGEVWIAGADDGRLLFVGADIDRSVQAHSAGIKCLSRAGDRLLTIGYDQRFVIWGIGPDGHLLPRGGGELPPQAWARSGCLLGDDKAVFASFGSRYLIHDLTDGSWDLGSYLPSPALNAVAVSGGKVYSIGDAGTLHIDGKPAVTVPSLCNALLVSGGSVLVAGQTGVLFDGQSGSALHVHNAPINRIAAMEEMQDGTGDIVLGTYDGSLILLSLEGGTVSSVQNVPVASSAIKGIYCRGDRIFCGSAGGTLAIVKFRSGEVLRRVEAAHSSILNDVSSCGNGFVTVSRDRTLRRWSRDGDPIDCVSTRHEHSVKSVGSSEGGRYSATGSYGGTVDIFDHEKGEWVGPLRRPTMAGIPAIVWDPDRSCFLAASYDGCIYEVHVHGN